PGSLSARQADRRRQGVRSAGRAHHRRCGKACARLRTAARHPRHRVSATRVGCDLRHSGRLDGDLFGSGQENRCAEIRPRGRERLRIECDRGRHSVPSRSAHGRFALGLSLGRRTQARAARPGEGRVSARPAARLKHHPAPQAIAARIEALDWERIAADLDAHGCATTGVLLDADESPSLRQAYAADALFRSRIVMARHGFGRGECKYFAYPLPDLVAALRAWLYAPLADIANAWCTVQDRPTRYPREHEAYLARCHEAGQCKPTPLLLSYGS